MAYPRRFWRVCVFSKYLSEQQFSKPEQRLVDPPLKEKAGKRCSATGQERPFE
ncbi:MAG: hypothetical protein J0H31_23480 [Alphaproteobacteria bacterium]|nr:hypothetical protein [Alphaproteobacteria bacterium]